MKKGNPTTMAEKQGTPVSIRNYLQALDARNRVADRRDRLASAKQAHPSNNKAPRPKPGEVGGVALTPVMGVVG